MGEGRTGTCAAGSGAHSQANPGTTELTDVRRRDSHLRNVSRDLILPGDLSSHPMETFEQPHPSPQ